MAETPRSGLSPRTIAAGVVGALALVFVFQNTSRGQINVLFWTISMPAWIWLLVVFGAGVGVGLLLSRRRSRAKGAKS